MSNQYLCPNCEENIEEGYEYCPSCGLSLTKYWMKFDGLSESGSYTRWQLIRESYSSMFNQSSTKFKPSTKIYLNRPLGSLFKFIITALTLVLIGLFLSYGTDWLSYIGFTVAGYAAPILYVIWMFYNDRYEQEPVALIAFIFGWGVIAGILSGLINDLITRPFLGPGGAAFVEEPLKVLGIYYLARNPQINMEFNDHLDGMVYGAAAGAGFAGLENLWYLLEMIFTHNYPALLAIFLRSITAFGHIAWTAIAGRSLGLGKVLKGRVEIIDVFPGLMISIILHFFWNITTTDVSLFLILPLTVILLQRMIKNALADEARWGFQYYAPDETRSDEEQIV